jgi:tetratricopeptide (TPR) repeat protein
LQQIGEGGMGTIFMAEQTEPVPRKVALKIIKPGMDSRQIVARFEAERQALALMDHPNIARVLDAGTTESGRPYFVMELVHGVPITRYCDERRLTPTERLELFVPVCQAVQHAHQKGIIHRDLKPSNVLVCLYDGKPVPKVIDFGVAKATGRKLTEKTLYTEFGAVIGTLEYMSPEQAELNQLDIDTRSDVYSLGVLLYELLTGTTPLEMKRLEEVAILEVLRVTREEEPPRPSTRLSTTEELPRIAANRGLEPKKLSGLVRGELDWIVMKALEKDRNRRYDTAGGLAADVERYLKDEPVQACPPSAGYRLRKFVRRNKGPMLAVAAVFAALTAGAVVSTCLAVKALAERDAKELARLDTVDNARWAREAADAEKKAKEAEGAQRKQAEAVAGLLESMFRGMKPGAAEVDLKGELVRQLDETATTLEKEYAGEPLVRARLRNAMGLARQSLGDYDKAVELFRQAAAERRTNLGPDHADTLESENNLAEAYRHACWLDKALPLHKQVLEKRKETLGPDHEDTLLSMNNLAWTYGEFHGDMKLALPLLEEALRRSRECRGLDDSRTLNRMSNLAEAYARMGRTKEALEMHREALDKTVARVGPNAPAALQFLNALGEAFRDGGFPDQARPLYEESLGRHTATFGAEHPRTLRTMSALAGVQVRTGQADRGLAMSKEVLEKLTAKLGADHPAVLTTLADQGVGLQEAGRPDEAVRVLKEALEKLAKKLGPDHQNTLTCQLNLATAYIHRNQHRDAVPLLKEALDKGSARFGPGHPLMLTVANNLGVAYINVGKPEKAVPLLLQAREHLLARRGPDHKDTLANQYTLGTAYAKAGRTRPYPSTNRRWFGCEPRSSRDIATH